MQMDNGCRRIHKCEHCSHKPLTPLTKGYAHLTTYSDSAMTPRRSHDSTVLPHKKQANARRLRADSAPTPRGLREFVCKNWVEMEHKPLRGTAQNWLRMPLAYENTVESDNIPF